MLFGTHKRNAVTSMIVVTQCVRNACMHTRAWRRHICTASRRTQTNIHTSGHFFPQNRAWTDHAPYEDERTSPYMIRLQACVHVGMCHCASHLPVWRVCCQSNWSCTKNTNLLAIFFSVHSSRLKCRTVYFDEFIAYPSCRPCLPTHHWNSAQI